MNKSLLTNLIALGFAALAYHLQQDWLFTMSVFALSGAMTNWLAIHMLFEKVPGLYGSGVIPAHFEEFKVGIRNLVMDQFFSDENIDRFLKQNSTDEPHNKLSGVIKKVDLSPAFDTLVKTIMESSFGSMLSMLGGEEALKPLKQPFIDNMRDSMAEIIASDEFSALLIEEIENPEMISGLKQNIKNIIDSRLEELTPDLVKQIIQDMIRQHLGWLVVWGGLFGALIGLLSVQFGIV